VRRLEVHARDLSADLDAGDTHAPTGEGEPWRHLALRYMEHVRTKLWNTSDANTAPVRRATRDDMTLCSWIQAAEWDAVLVREMLEQLP